MTVNVKRLGLASPNLDLRRKHTVTLKDSGDFKKSFTLNFVQITFQIDLAGDLVKHPCFRVANFKDLWLSTKARLHRLVG